MNVYKSNNIPQQYLKNTITPMTMDINDIKNNYPAFAKEFGFYLVDNANNKTYWVVPAINVSGHKFSFNCVADSIWKTLDLEGVLYSKKQFKKRGLKAKDAARALFVHNCIRQVDLNKSYDMIVNCLGGAFPQLNSVVGVVSQLNVSRNDDSKYGAPLIDCYGEMIPADKVADFILKHRHTEVGAYVAFGLSDRITSPINTAQIISPDDPNSFLDIVNMYISI